MEIYLPIRPTHKGATLYMSQNIVITSAFNVKKGIMNADVLIISIHFGHQRSHKEAFHYRHVSGLVWHFYA